MRTPRRSRRSGTPSTTSSPTPPPAEPGVPTLAGLLAALGPERRRQVVTHRSWAASHVASYERLEFLGDSVLQVVVTAELLARHPDATEGDLAWMRQAVVGRDACARAAEDTGLPELMVACAPAAQRDAAAAVSRRASVRAALVEALIGACATDLGMDVTGPAVLGTFAPALEAAVPGRRDPKTALQERAARDRRDVVYELVAQEGPPHDRRFRTRVLVGGEELGSGEGTSKQESEQGAAAAALATMDETDGEA